MILFSFPASVVVILETIYKRYLSSSSSLFHFSVFVICPIVLCSSLHLFLSIQSVPQIPHSVLCLSSICLCLFLLLFSCLCHLLLLCISLCLSHILSCPLCGLSVFVCLFCLPLFSPLVCVFLLSFSPSLCSSVSGASFATDLP